MDIDPSNLPRGQQALRMSFKGERNAGRRLEVEPCGEVEQVELVFPRIEPVCIHGASFAHPRRQTPGVGWRVSLVARK